MREKERERERERESICVHIHVHIHVHYTYTYIHTYIGCTYRRHIIRVRRIHETYGDASAQPYNTSTEKKMMSYGCTYPYILRKEAYFLRKGAYFQVKRGLFPGV